MSKAAFAVLFCISVCVPGRAASQDVRPERAERLYQRACDGGDLVACNIFGLMRETGQGVSRDLDQARQLYRRACEGGELTGCTNLGLIYGRGLGVPQDLERARGNYLVACEGGQPLGCDLNAALDSVGSADLARVPPDSTRLAASAGAAAPNTGQLYSKTGRVADASNTRGLSNVVVDVPTLGIHAISDDEGRVSLGRMPAGRYGIVAERFGYDAVNGTLEVPGSAEFLILMDRTNIDDPFATGQVRGRVSDVATHEPLSDVGVEVVGQEGAVLSDSDGRFFLRSIKPGLLEVRLTRIGYAPRTATLVLQPGGEGEITAAMSTEAIELAPIEVTTAGRMDYLDRVGFTDRQARGLGTQFTRADVEKYAFRQMSDLIRRANGILVGPGTGVPPTAYATNPRVNSFQGGCTIPLYIDGVLSFDKDLNQLPGSFVDAVEIYTGQEVPIQYGGTMDCDAVILIWTRR